MSKKIFLFSNKLTIFSAVISLLYIYFISIDKHIYVGFFLCMMFILTITTINSLYLFSIKQSLFGKMNIKKIKIYKKLYLWGLLSYLPILVVVVTYSAYNFVDLGLIGIGLIIIQPINMELIVRNKSIKGIIITSIISILSLVILYMIGLEKVMNG